MILAEGEKKTDLSQVATSHLIRLIIIITVFPFIVNSFYDVESVKDAQINFSEQNITHLVLLIISSIFLIIIFDRFKIPYCFFIRYTFCQWFFTNFRYSIV